MLRDKSVTGGIAMLEGAGTGYEGLQDCLMHKGPDLRGFNARELFVVSDDSDGFFVLVLTNSSVSFKFLSAKLYHEHEQMCRVLSCKS